MLMLLHLGLRLLVHSQGFWKDEYLYGYSDHAVEMVQNWPRDPVHMVQDLVGTYPRTWSHTPLLHHWTGDTGSLNWYSPRL